LAVAVLVLTVFRQALRGLELRAQLVVDAEGALVQLALAVLAVQVAAEVKVKLLVKMFLVKEV
jgi:hypothetical protein